MPTGKSIMIHMWEKAKQYLHKMGGIILVASIIIWFLGYFPRHSESGDQFDRQIAEIENTELDSQEKTDTIEELERLKAIDHQQNSYIGAYRPDDSTDLGSFRIRLENECKPTYRYGGERSCCQHVKRIIHGECR